MLAGCVPWPDDFAASYKAAGYWQARTTGEVPLQAARRFGGREAVVCPPAPELGSPGLRLTYRELAVRVERVAVGLTDLGLEPGERVLLQLPNVPEFLLLYFALARLGVLPIMALPPHRQTEIAYLAEFGEVAAYVVPASYRGFDYPALARELWPRLDTLRYTIVVGGEAPDEPGFVPFDALVADADAAEAASILADYHPDPYDVALFLLSGGTTGLPKLIPRTHADYLYNSVVSGDVAEFGADTVYLVAVPISHNFPLACPGAQGTLMRGGKVVLAPSPDPEALFALVESERVTHLAMVPAMTIAWLNHPARSRYDLSSLQVLQVGGSRLSPEVARRVPEELGCRVQQVYGMAEGLLNFTRLDDAPDVIAETQGRPVSTADEVRVVDDDDRDVPAGAVGELLTRGPYTIRGYYRAPEHDAVAFTADGYYRSGDLVRQDAGGNFSVEGRKKDMINRGGEKISAEEIENLILAHPSVHLTAVVAMPDPVLGERACACVVLREGATLTLPELVAFLEQRGIARFKLPERLELLDALPLTSVGKVSKVVLRERVAAATAASAESRAPKAG
jgi:2,3-dihydroxybenzoate-AMP ligase